MVSRRAFEKTGEDEFICFLSLVETETNRHTNGRVQPIRPVKRYATPRHEGLEENLTGTETC